VGTVGDGDESYGDGDNVENSSGMGWGLTGAGTVGVGDKYLSPCSSLVTLWQCIKTSECGFIKLSPFDSP